MENTVCFVPLMRPGTIYEVQSLLVLIDSQKVPMQVKGSLGVSTGHACTGIHK